MVTTDTTQLNKECNSWRDELRSCRNEMGRLRDQLQRFATGQNDKEILSEVEHFHNQFYIQQINIHDLKQAIKNHDRKLAMDISSLNGKVSDETISEHEELNDQYENLKHTIDELRSDFANFVAKV